MQQKPQYQEISYRGQWDGVNTMAPENIIPPTSSPFIKNFMLRNKQIFSFPRFKQAYKYPEDNQPIRGLLSFLDTNNVMHTVGLTAHNAYQLNYIAQSGGQDERWIWNQLGSFSGSDQLYTMAVYLNKLYWATGVPGLFYWDGITNQIHEATNYVSDAYDATKPIYGGYYLGELASHLILLNTVEQDPTISGNSVQSYTQRMRWSASGQPTVWNPASNPNAGFNDLLDVPDQITGFMTIGRYGYIFRFNGISQVIPTGLGSRPFQWDHLWASNQGIGNIYPATIASYGSIGVFISLEQIYMLTIGGIQSIGKGARDAIFTDLTKGTGGPLSSIVPCYAGNFVYMTYHLVIPMNGFTVIWIYNVEEQSWTRREIQGTYIASPIKFAWVK